MNQYNNQSRLNRGKSGSPYRRDSGKNGFLSVILFYVLPFLIVNGLIFFLVTAKPKGEILIGESSDYISTAIELKIKSHLPLKDMELTLDGTPVELTKTGSRTYTAVLTSNGSLEARLINFNQMRTVLNEQVNVLDDTPPAVKDNSFKNGILSFRLEDTQSGVDFSSITASDDNDPKISPLSIDRSTGLITFEMDKKNIAVIARDMIGNELHVTFTPEGESIEDMDTDDAAESGDDTDSGDAENRDADSGDADSSVSADSDPESGASKSSVSGSNTLESSTGKSSTERSGTSKSSTSKSSTKKSSTKKSSTKKSSTEKSSTEKSSTKKSSTEKSSTAKSSTSKNSTSKSQN